jgi:RHS repeat-associated protein
VEELVGGSVQRVYTYGSRLISQSQQLNGGWQESFYGLDAHSNVRFLTDGDGAVTDTYAYDAFGVLTSSTGTTPNNYLFNGQQYDHDLGLYFKRARYYSQDRGRFMTMDPVAGRLDEPMTLHRYMFGHADPVNRIDPCGTTAALEYGMTMKDTLRLAAQAALISYRISCIFYRATSAIDPDFVPPAAFASCTVDTCKRLLDLCVLKHPWPARRARKGYDGPMDCGLCFRNCKANHGEWPFDMCPIF